MVPLTKDINAELWCLPFFAWTSCWTNKVADDLRYHDAHVTPLNHARLCGGLFSITRVEEHPANKQRNKYVIITSKRRFDLMMRAYYVVYLQGKHWSCMHWTTTTVLRVCPTSAQQLASEVHALCEGHRRGLPPLWLVCHIRPWTLRWLWGRRKWTSPSIHFQQNVILIGVMIERMVFLDHSSCLIKMKLGLCIVVNISKSTVALTLTDMIN